MISLSKPALRSRKQRKIAAAIGGYVCPALFWRVPGPGCSEGPKRRPGPQVKTRLQSGRNEAGQPGRGGERSCRRQCRQRQLAARSITTLSLHAIMWISPIISLAPPAQAKASVVQGRTVYHLHSGKRELCLHPHPESEQILPPRQRARWGARLKPPPVPSANTCKWKPGPKGCPPDRCSGQADDGASQSGAPTVGGW